MTATTPTIRDQRRWRCPICCHRHTPHCPGSTQGIRWPTEPILNVRTMQEIADKVGIGLDAVKAARYRGLSDTQADLWATRCDLHPVMVWPDWINAGLTEADRRLLGGVGWRPAWLHAEGLAS